MSPQTTRAASDAAWRYLPAGMLFAGGGVVWFVGGMVWLTALTLSPSYPRYDDQAYKGRSHNMPFEREVFLNDHDCEEHEKLPHVVSDKYESAWATAESERNKQHRQLCIDLRLKAKEAITMRRIKRAEK